MQIHQAVFGERNGAHVLLVSNSPSNAFITRLASRTDRPGTALPGNLKWDPYLSGYPLDSWYIISRTFPDTTASRGGMVRTYVLAFDLDEATHFSDLTPLLNILPSSIKDKNIEIWVPSQPKELAVDRLTRQEIPSESANAFIPGLTKAVSMLVSPELHNRPVVWVGQDGFTELISNLWPKLWPGARSTFSFRISFSPQDVEDQQWTLVSTPTSLENRWVGYLKSSVNERYTPQTISEALVLGLPNGEPLRVLIQELGSPQIQVSQLWLVERVYNYVRNIEHLNAAEARGLVRLLEKLVPSPNLGSGLKSRVLDRLAKVTRTGSAIDIKGLRGISSPGFTNGPSVVENIIQDWFTNAISEGSQEWARETLEVVKLAFDINDKADSEWVSTIRRSLETSFTSWQSSTARIVWKWWEQEDDSVELIEPVLKITPMVEEDLAKICPKRLRDSLGSRVCELARRHKLYQLNAASASAYLSAEEAIRDQLSLGTDTTYALTGLRLLETRVPGKELVSAALKLGDATLELVAGEVCARNPELMGDLDVREQSWRRLWLHAIQAGSSPFTGVLEPVITVFILMDLILEEHDIEVALIEKIAKSQYADLSTYTNRVKIWRRLDITVKADFLTATAKSWLEQLRTDALSGFELEPELENGILEENQVRAYLDVTRFDTVHAAIRLFERFPHLTQDLFMRWLGEFIGTHRTMDSWNARNLGQLIQKRRWAQAAEQLAYEVLHHYSSDFEPVLYECQSQLGFFTRIGLTLMGKLHGVSITVDDWWNALAELVSRLYPGGPLHHSIWERSGGDPAALGVHESGRSSWHVALNLVRHGGGGEINVSSLLREIRRAYANNRELGQLEEVGRRLGQFM